MESLEKGLQRLEQELRRIVSMPPIAGGAPLSAEFTLGRILEVVGNIGSVGGGAHASDHNDGGSDEIQRIVFKRTTIEGQGDITTTSATFVAISATLLPYLTLNLDVGDVVRCTLQIGEYYVDASTAQVGFDFEVDQPISGDTRIGANAEHGLAFETKDGTREHACIIGYFTATEAGVHGFRPMWKTSAQTLRIANETSGLDDAITSFCVEKLGAPAA